MTNLNIDLPSKRAARRVALLLEIEKPLRRKFRRKTDYIALLYTVIILGTLVVTLLHFFVEPNLI